MIINQRLIALQIDYQFLFQYELSFTTSLERIGKRQTGLKLNHHPTSQQEAHSPLFTLLSHTN